MRPTRQTPALTARVERGAAFLDAHRPGWDQQINLPGLDLGRGEACVLGQSFDGHYAEGKALLHAELPFLSRAFRTSGATAAQHGFNIRFRQFESDAQAYYFSQLTEAWIDLVQTRRARTELADATALTSLQQEQNTQTTLVK